MGIKTLNGITLTFPDTLPSDDRVKVLAKAFDRVKNAEHWKGPIDAVIHPTYDGEVTDITEAIEFYTATSATVHYLGDGFRITAPGYWGGPAN